MTVLYQPTRNLIPFGCLQRSIRAVKPHSGVTTKTTNKTIFPGDSTWEIWVQTFELAAEVLPQVLDDNLVLRTSSIWFHPDPACVPLAILATDLENTVSIVRGNAYELIGVENVYSLFSFFFFFFFRRAKPS